MAFVQHAIKSKQRTTHARKKTNKQTKRYIIWVHHLYHQQFYQQKKNIDEITIKVYLAIWTRSTQKIYLPIGRS